MRERTQSSICFLLLYSFSVDSFDFLKRVRHWHLVSCTVNCQCRWWDSEFHGNENFLNHHLTPTHRHTIHTLNPPSPLQSPFHPIPSNPQSRNLQSSPLPDLNVFHHLRYPTALLVGDLSRPPDFVPLNGSTLPPRLTRARLTRFFCARVLENRTPELGIVLF